jgi:D-xylose transport system permease protein
MATKETGDLDRENQPGSVAVAGEPANGTGTADAAVSAAPELLAQSLGEYGKIWLRRVRSGESGALPVIVGLIALGIYFQSSQSHFLSAINIFNLMGQAGWIITIAMAEACVLLLGEIDLSVAYNASIGATVTAWMVSIHHPYPTGVAILVGLAVCGAIGAIQGLITVWLKIPSFIVTLGGLLGLNGVLIWLFEKTGNIGLGGVISLHNTFLFDLTTGEMTPAVGWIVLIVGVVLGGAYVITRDQRRRGHGLVAPPLGVTLLKIVLAGGIGAALVAVLNVAGGVPWVVPIVIVLLGIMTVVLTRIKFGRYLYAVGGNAEAARRAGINLSRIRVLAFTCTGLLAGVTGILYMSLLGSISTDFQGGQYVLYAVAGAVIGGISLFGGRGRMLGAVLGGFVVAVIYNGVDLLGLGAAGQYIWTALVLLAAVALDALARRGSTPA